MTTPDHLPDDELVSSVLDDEADDTERARVAADPVLAERLDAFRDLRAEMRDVTIPTGLLDSLRATALDTTAAAGPVTAPVFDLSARRARRTKAARWVGAAAAAVVLIAAIGLAGRSGDDTSSGDASMTAVFGSGSTGSTGSRQNESATAGAAGSSPDLGASTGASAAASGDTSKSSGTGSTAAPSAPLSDLGTFADLDALSAAYRARAAGGPVPTTVPTATATTTGTTCGGVVALAVLGTRPVGLVAEGNRVLVVDRVSCATVTAFTA